MSPTQSTLLYGTSKDARSTLIASIMSMACTPWSTQMVVLEIRYYMSSLVLNFESILLKWCGFYGAVCHCGFYILLYREIVQHTHVVGYYMSSFDSLQMYKLSTWSVAS